MMEKLKDELNDEEMGRINTIFKDGKIPARKKLEDAMSVQELMKPEYLMRCRVLLKMKEKPS
jgi:hypothetical protein